MSKTLQQINDPAIGLPDSQAALAPIEVSAHKGMADQCKVQCGRCFNMMEIAPERVRSHMRCTQCHRSLRLGKVIRHLCTRCGMPVEFSVGASGRHVSCPKCATRQRLAVQVAQLRHRRRRRRGVQRGVRRVNASSGLISLTVALGATILGLMLCFRLLTSM